MDWTDIIIWSDMNRISGLIVGQRIQSCYCPNSPCSVVRWYKYASSIRYLQLHRPAYQLDLTEVFTDIRGALLWVFSIRLLNYYFMEDINKVRIVESLAWGQWIMHICCFKNWHLAVFCDAVLYIYIIMKWVTLFWKVSLGPMYSSITWSHCVNRMGFIIELQR